MANVDQSLIFDLGLHHGLDSKFYLDKGFRVVGLEANPDMAARAQKQLQGYIDAGKFAIVVKALTDSDDPTISFYVNPVKDDWSSTQKSWAEKEAHPSREITVPTVKLPDLVKEFGVPYYVKCDIEGEDAAFVRQLRQLETLPTYISVEAISADLIDILAEVGYTEFQVVNQALFWQFIPPQPPLEGGYVEVKFNGHMSGLFGKELPADRWFTAARIKETFLQFLALRRVDPNLTYGWLDFHARRPT